MKRALICVLSFLLLLTSGLVVKKNNEILIIVDAGHGGFDPGAVYNEVLEKNLNLNIALKLEEKLQSLGIKVEMIRKTDIDFSSDPNHLKKSDLDKRIEIINKSQAKMFISIHMNSYPMNSLYGAQTFYKKNETNEIIASFIQKSLVKNLKTTRKQKEIRDIYLLDNVNKNGVLVEMGFLSNDLERNLLLNDLYQEKCAYSITEGIVDYLNSIE